MHQPNLAKTSKVRAPWRPLLQLRREDIPVDPAPGKTAGLANAARLAEPPTLPDAWMAYEARRRLLLVCEWLEERLENPVRIHRLKNGGRQIDIFESLAYTVCPKDQIIASGLLRNGEFHRNNCIFEIGRPITSSGWLTPILQQLGLMSSRQGDLFLGESNTDHVARWIEATAFQVVC